MQRGGEKFLITTKDVGVMKPRRMLIYEKEKKWCLCEKRNACRI
jgi:hypothetical protein